MDKNNKCPTCGRLNADDKKSFWDVDHPNYPRTDWKAEVEAGDTQLGYHDWLIHQVEGEE